MKRILLLSLLLVSNFGFGQEPVIEWQKSLGGSEDDYVRLIEQTADEGYIIVGMSTSTDGDVTGNNGFWDYWVVKLDASGSITWEKSLGGSTFDHGHSIQQTADGGYIVVGDSKSNDGNVTVNNDFNKIWIIKLDASGNIMWQSSFGGWSDDHGYSVQQTANGGFIIAGDSESNEDDVSGNNGGRDCWIVRLDATGNIIWKKSLGGSGYDYATSIQQMTDAGYIVAGNSESLNGDVTGNNGAIDYWIVKLDATGNTMWQKSLGGSGDDSAISIQQTTEGGYVVAGNSDSNNGDITGNNGEFKMIDAQGREVLTGKMNGIEHTINISNLTKGVYSVVFDDSVLPVLSVIKE